MEAAASAVGVTFIRNKLIVSSFEYWAENLDGPKAEVCRKAGDAMRSDTQQLLKDKKAGKNADLITAGRQLRNVLMAIGVLKRGEKFDDFDPNKLYHVLNSLTDVDRDVAKVEVGSVKKSIEPIFDNETCSPRIRLIAFHMLLICIILTHVLQKDINFKNFTTEIYNLFTDFFEYHHVAFTAMCADGWKMEKVKKFLAWFRIGIKAKHAKTGMAKIWIMIRKTILIALFILSNKPSQIPTIVDLLKLIDDCLRSYENVIPMEGRSMILYVVDEQGQSSMGRTVESFFSHENNFRFRLSGNAMIVELPNLRHLIAVAPGVNWAIDKDRRLVSYTALLPDIRSEIVCKGLWQTIKIATEMSPPRVYAKKFVNSYISVFDANTGKLLEEINFPPPVKDGNFLPPPIYTFTVSPSGSILVMDEGGSAQYSPSSMRKDRVWKLLPSYERKVIKKANRPTIPVDPFFRTDFMRSTSHLVDRGFFVHIEEYTHGLTVGFGIGKLGNVPDTYFENFQNVSLALKSTIKSSAQLERDPLKLRFIRQMNNLTHGPQDKIRNSGNFTEHELTDLRTFDSYEGIRNFSVAFNSNLMYLSVLEE